MVDIVGAFFILASGNVANKFLLQYMSGELLVAIRMTVSGALLLLYHGRSSERLRWKYIRSDVMALTLIILCTALLPALLKAFALKYMPVSKQSLLGSIDPFITALYSYMLFNERITWRMLLGMTVGCSGIIISLLSSSPAEMLWGHISILSYPELAVVGAVALSRYGWMVVQGMLRKGRYEPSELNGIAMLSGGLMAFGLCAVRGTVLNVPVELYAQFFGVLCYTTLIGNVIGYTAYAYCLRRHSANLVALAGLLFPLFAALLSWLIGLEQLTWHFFVALFCVAIGLFILQGAQKKD